MLYIDGVDAYLEYGAVVAGKNAYKDVVCFPAMKTVKANDWPEDDGVEADLSPLVYRVDTRSIGLTFAFHGPNRNIDGFIGMLSDSVTHRFLFATFMNRTNALRLDLRLVSCSKMDDVPGGRIGSITLKFSEDGYGYYDVSSSAPFPTIPQNDDYIVNGTRLSLFNVNVLKGTLDSVRKPADVKQNLTVNSATENGVLYDIAGEVLFKQKDVKLNCLMRASKAMDFWTYHRALFDLITLPGGQTLYVEALDKEYPCYYKGCSVSEFYPSIGGIVWMKFTLTFTITGELRPIPGGLLLATEDGGYLLAGEAYIDMNPEQ